LKCFIFISEFICLHISYPCFFAIDRYVGDGWRYGCPYAQVTVCIGQYNNSLINQIFQLFRFKILLVIYYMD